MLRIPLVEFFHCDSLLKANILEAIFLKEKKRETVILLSSFFGGFPNILGDAGTLLSPWLLDFNK